MSYSRRQLYAFGETFGDSATSMEAGGRIIYGGGGGKSKPQPTTTITESGPTVTDRTTTNEIPQYLTNASQDLIARGQALTSRPYEAYTGPRVAEFSPLMNQAFERIGGQQVAGQIGEATGLASLAGQRAMDYGQFQTGVQQYMNPYMQNVVDIERRKAQEAADQQSAMLSGQAAKMGAFGGSGAALQQRALTRDTARQLSDIQAQGLDRAYQSAVGQYNQGISSGLAAAGQLGGLGQQQFGQQMDITQGLGTAGDVQRQRQQALLDVGYGDYLTAQKYPYEQLAFQQGLISGVPYSTTQRTNEVSTPGKTVSQMTATPAAGPNPASQVIGAGLAAYGAIDGGSGDANGANFASGGIASLSDQQIARRRQMPNITELALLSLDAEARRREKERLAAKGTQYAQMGEQPTVAEEQMAMLEQGIGGLDVPDDLVSDEGMAGGGIVAFQAGGKTGWEEELERLQAPPQESSALGRWFSRNDDVEAMKARGLPTPAAKAAPAGGIADMAREMRKFQGAGPGVAGITDQAPAVTTAPSAIAPPAVQASGAKPAAEGTGIASALPKSIQSLMDDRRKAVEAAAQEGVSMAEADRAAVERDQAEMGEPGAEREKRLKAQEESLKGAADKGFNMALIEAGLAIMAGESENALVNIGKGAMIGTKAYRESMDKIAERRAKLDEALINLDEMRFGAKKADKKELREAEAAVNKAKQQTAAALAAVTGEDMKMSVDLYTKQLDRQATLAAANARGAGGAGGAGGDNKLITAAEAAFQRDPEAAAIRKRLESTLGTMNKAKEAADLARLREIQAAKYKQYGISMDQGASAPDLTGWGKAQAVN